uniref:Uncharacterized protein n=1 Tax=Lepeophtheirus salmonis TaxID=72036 RepID=A0A0K2VEJ7_LEPSM
MDLLDNINIKMFGATLLPLVGTSLIKFITGTKIDKNWINLLFTESNKTKDRILLRLPLPGLCARLRPSFFSFFTLKTSLPEQPTIQTISVTLT